MTMRMRFTSTGAAILLTVASFAVNDGASAQNTLRRLSLKNGESIELYALYFVSNCHSIMIGLPEIEVLEGPPEVALSIREEPVLPRRQGCAAKVAGGTLVLTAKDVTETAEAKLTYRLNYKTKDGPRQSSAALMVSLFPDH